MNATRLVHDPMHCQCHRCERLNRSALRRALRDGMPWAFVAITGTGLVYAVINWIARGLPGCTRIG